MSISSGLRRKMTRVGLKKKAAAKRRRLQYHQMPGAGPYRVFQSSSRTMRKGAARSVLRAFFRNRLITKRRQAARKILSKRVPRDALQLISDFL